MKKERKNVLIINAHDYHTGAGRSCFFSLKILKDSGFKITMISHAESNLSTDLQECGIDTIVSRFPTWYPAEIKYKGITKGLTRMKKILIYIKQEYQSYKTITKQLNARGFSPDIIYTNTILYSIGLLLSWKYKVPHIYHIREYGKADFNRFFLLGKYLSKLWAKKYTIAAVCISKGVYNEWYGLFGEKATLVYNGLKIDSTQEREKEQKKVLEKLRIVIVGRLSEEKGQEHVIDVIKKMHDDGYNSISLDLYGDGVDRQKLESQINRYKLEDFVHLKGFQNEIDYGSYDVAIMSSRSEAFGRVTIEYMINGVPVIGFRGGATPELVQDKVTGRLYSNKNDLYEILLDVMANYHSYSLYANNAYNFVQDNFSEDVYRRTFLKVFNSVACKE